MRRQRCIICGQGALGYRGHWCTGCAHAWDRQRTRDDGSILAAMNWAARRARRFATRAISHPGAPTKRLVLPRRSPRKRRKLTDAEWGEVFRFRCEVKQGRPITKVARKLVDAAYDEDPKRYAALDKDVFNATVPFGSTKRWE